MEKTVESMLNRRDNMLKKRKYDVPKQHETLSNLGNFLGKTILNTMSPIAKELMGVETTLPVAPKTLWIPPDDRLEGKIMLKPLPNYEVVKALTHVGILEIGSKVEDNVRKRCEAKIDAVRKEVENFERFECINRVKFAMLQGQISNEQVLKDQRLDLLDIFQKDRQELIEASKIDTKIVKNSMVNEDMIQTAEKEKLNFEHISIADKIKEMNDRIILLGNEIDIGKNKLVDEVEKRKQKDWNILRLLCAEMQKQYMQQITYMEIKHNAEIRHIYDENQVKTFRTDSEESGRVTKSSASMLNSEKNDKIEFKVPSGDDDILESGSDVIDEKIEFNQFNQFNQPFVVELSKVEGEYSQDDNSPKLDAHSTGSSFKCYRNHSKYQKSSETSSNTNLTDEKIVRSDSCGSIKMCDIQSHEYVRKSATEINTTDISCKIIRLLGVHLNLANIEKVKKELDDLIFKYMPKSVQGSNLLLTTDSLDIIAESIPPVQHLRQQESMPLVGITDSRELLAKKSIAKSCTDMDTDEHQNKKNSKIFPKSAKATKILESKQIIHLTEDEYINSLKPVPKYMQCNSAKISIWDYRTMTDHEWNQLLLELQIKQENKSNDTNSKTKTVTVNSSISAYSSGSVKYSNRPGKPVKGILISKSDNQINSEPILNNEMFQNDEIQSLVNKFNE